MSRIVILFLAVCLLAVFVEQTRAKLTRGESGRLRRRQVVMASDLDNYPVNDDMALLQPIFRTPLKRQWCRSGMSYNPVIGSCTLSLAALRGRGRSYRGV